MTPRMADWIPRKWHQPSARLIAEHLLYKSFESQEEIAAESKFGIPQEPGPDPFGFDDPPPETEPRSLRSVATPVMTATWSHSSTSRV